jgi:hypothetical protein
MPEFIRRQKYIDWASTLTLVVTIVLFAIAAFETGFTHDLLQEAGVLLISAKLVLASYQAKITNASIEKKLDELSKKMDAH